MQMKQKSRPTIAETDKTDEKNIILKQKKKQKKNGIRMNGRRKMDEPKKEEN